MRNIIQKSNKQDHLNFAQDTDLAADIDLCSSSTSALQTDVLEGSQQASDSFIFQSFIGYCLFPISVVSIVIGFSRFLTEFSLYDLALIITGSGLALIALRLINQKNSLTQKGIDRLANDLQVTIEQIRDIQWELRDSESRYRDLLDSQEDIIIRRDDEGRLTYINGAFSRFFGQNHQTALGNCFTPRIIDGDKTPELEFSAMEGRKRYCQKVNTVFGPRWFVWEEFAIRNEDLEIKEIQSIGHNITEQKEVEDALQDARDQAESANRAKSQFLATMSHEIRTPMNGVLGMTDLMMGTKLSPEQQTYCRAINSSAKSLLSLIDQILDFSKIEAGKLELENRPFDLRETVQSVIELLAPKGHDKGLEIAWFIDPLLAKTMIGDEVRFRQILTNLVGNGIKFTNDGGVCVEIVSGHGGQDRNKIQDGNDSQINNDLFSPTSIGDNQQIQICVKDTGIGLSKKAQSLIFKDFEQADSSHARRYGGTGLGLAITKRIAEQMDGTIDLRSELGKGSVFTINLNMKKHNSGGGLYHAWELPDDFHRILLTGSLKIEMQILARTLQGVGMQAQFVAPENALAAIKEASIRSEPFEVLFHDTAVPELKLKKIMNMMREGLEQTGMVKRLLNFIILDVSERGKFSYFQQQGMDGYLTRPVRAASVFARLNAQSNHHQEQQAVIEAHSIIQKKIIHNNLNGQFSVLMAEDNAINALLATTILQSNGITVHHVENGLLAIEKIKNLMMRESILILF